MLVPITLDHALKELTNEENRDKVYFKEWKSYDLVIDYAWAFNDNVDTYNLLKTEFYLEVEE